LPRRACRPHLEQGREHARSPAQIPRQAIAPEAARVASGITSGSTGVHRFYKVSRFWVLQVVQGSKVRSGSSSFKVLRGERSQNERRTRQNAVEPVNLTRGGMLCRLSHLRTD
jgi:hypothetical protein